MKRLDSYFPKNPWRLLATTVVVLVTVLAGLVIYRDYVVAPWTRDGRTRVQVANVAPQVSGQVSELRVVDNQVVRRGDVLYVIDQFDFRTALAGANATVVSRQSDQQNKQTEANRRAQLGVNSTSVEEKQNFASQAAQAGAALESAQAQLRQAEINLARTVVRSPVNGVVTNLLMRVGDYAREGTTNISVIDSDSYWIDGYFEETKLGYICIGDPARVSLLGFRLPIEGVVESLTRGISDSDAAASTQGLPGVNPVYTWVRLAQRVPIRIRITHVPATVPLIAGLTATVSLDNALYRAEGTGMAAWWGVVRRAFGAAPPTAACNIQDPTRDPDPARLPEARLPALSR